MKVTLSIVAILAFACRAVHADEGVFECQAVGGSNSNLECHKDGKATVIVHHLPTIDRVEYQLGNLVNGVFIPSNKDKCRCVVPAPDDSPCSANWKRKEVIIPTSVEGGTGGQLIPIVVEEDPVPNLSLDIYQRRRRAAEDKDEERVSSFTFEHDADCSGQVDVQQDKHGSYIQTVYVQIRELYATNNSQLLSVLDSPILSLKCINHVVQPKPKDVIPPPVENKNVVVCKTATFNVVAISEHVNQVPERIRVTITRDLALVEDTQQTWVVKSLNYSSDPVISDNLPRLPLAAVIGANVMKSTPNDDSFEVVTDYVVLQNASSLPIQANVGFRAAKGVLEIWRTNSSQPEPASNIKPAAIAPSPASSFFRLRDDVFHGKLDEFSGCLFGLTPAPSATVSTSWRTSKTHQTVHHPLPCR
ncbi:hypothetical protein BV898_10255 [Hypsibius exemplaris]|uniref:Uncharacterized protein n=1 Tax=Hypsibius exemplaris TaxID=2072580 RepID=A0A1W0WK81_HYPEX|nr:hypothetical protein BV898_10255 [Hypsibius exemplaris]